MSLLTLVNETKPLNAKAFLYTHLSPLPPSQQLDYILTFLHSASEVEETLTDITVSYAWTHLVSNNLWSHHYASLDHLRQDLEFDSTILPLLQKSQSVNKKVERHVQRTHRNWNMLPMDLFPPELKPPTLTEQLSIYIARLSDTCAPADALVLIQKRVQTHLYNHLPAWLQ